METIDFRQVPTQTPGQGPPTVVWLFTSVQTHGRMKLICTTISCLHTSLRHNIYERKETKQSVTT